MFSFYNLPILMYHNVDEFAFDSKLSVFPETFKKQLDYLQRKNIKVIPTADVYESLTVKNSKRACLTFDDGALNFYQNAYPLLKEYNFTATVFMATDFIGTKGYMNWSQLKELVKNGISIGAHTKTHRWLPDVPEKDLESEILTPKKFLEDGLGCPVDTMAYPFGAKNPKILELTEIAGYRCAFVTTTAQKDEAVSRFSLRRVKITNRSSSLLRFWFKTSGYYYLFGN